MQPLDAKSKDDDRDRVLAEFSRKLTAVAARYLDKRVRQRVAPEEVAQSVIRTFLRRKIQIDDKSQLWNLLVVICHHKAITQSRRNRAARRDVAREQADPDGGVLAQVAGNGTEPSDPLILFEELEAITRGYPDSYGEVVGLRLQGFSVQEIATQLGRGTSTIYRMLGDLKVELSARLSTWELAAKDDPSAEDASSDRQPGGGGDG